MKKNTTKIFIAAIFLTISGTAYAQEGRVGINTSTPAATLDVVASPSNTTRIDGFIAPRLKGSELKAKDGLYTTAQDGTIVYVTEALASANTSPKTANVTSIGYYYFDKTLDSGSGQWVKVANPVAAAVYQEPWNVQGGTTAATTNTQNIYQSGSVAIGRTLVYTNGSRTAALDVKDAIRTGAGHTGTIGVNSVAMGLYNEASGDTSFAAGKSNKSVGNNSFAVGNTNTSNGNTSTSFGSSNTNNGDNAVVMGSSNTVNAGSTNSFTGGGSNIMSGNYAFTMGKENTVEGEGSGAFGEGNKSFGARSIAVGYYNEARKSNTFAGGSNSIASGENSVAFGNASKATNGAATAFGEKNEANGYASVALGSESKADGKYSVAGGSKSVASGDNSVAFGLESKATNGAATAFGEYNEANGYSSAALGRGSIANGKYSVAVGVGAKTSSIMQTAIGSYNYVLNHSEDVGLNPTSYLFMVGDGYADNYRSNIIVAQAGNGWSTGNNTNNFVAIGSGTYSPTQENNERLRVYGRINATSYSVAAQVLTVPDYVFQKYYTGTSTLKGDYKFVSNLYDVENYLKENHHLPGVTSASEIKKAGFYNLEDMQMQSLEKVEELYLHTIEQQKQIDELKDIVKQQQKQIDQLLKK